MIWNGWRGNVDSRMAYSAEPRDLCDAIFGFYSYLSSTIPNHTRLAVGALVLGLLMGRGVSIVGTLLATSALMVGIRRETASWAFTWLGGALWLSTYEDLEHS